MVFDLCGAVQPTGIIDFAGRHLRATDEDLVDGDVDCRVNKLDMSSAFLLFQRWKIMKIMILE